MSKIDENNLTLALRTHLGSAGIDWNSFLAGAAEIVIFGSRALGVHSDTSDLDVLCFVNSKRRLLARQLDCICYPREEMNGAYWRGCELASHIARYGIWVVGDGTWRDSVRISRNAVERKVGRIDSLVKNAVVRWQKFHPLFRVKYATSIRRELQRLRLLKTGVPVPPTPVLDKQWSVGEVDIKELLYIATHGSGSLSRYAQWIGGQVCNGAGLLIESGEMPQIM